MDKLDPLEKKGKKKAIKSIGKYVGKTYYGFRYIFLRT